MMDLRKVYEYALQREHEGMSFFRQNAARFSHAAAAGAFAKLADEEQKHIEFIQAMIDGLDRDGSTGLETGSALEAEGFFSQRAQTEMLDQTVIESMVPDLSVLRMAYLIERDFAEFYEMAAGRVEDAAAKKALHMLARWERGHEELFKKMHDKAFELYAGMPWGG
jgi:rubrerythrin